MLTNTLTDEEMYERQIEYELMQSKLDKDVHSLAMKFAEKHYSMLVYLGKERFVDALSSGINKYCKKENIV